MCEKSILQGQDTSETSNWLLFHYVEILGLDQACCLPGSKHIVIPTDSLRLLGYRASLVVVQKESSQMLRPSASDGTNSFPRHTESSQLQLEDLANLKCTCLRKKRENKIKERAGRA